MLVQFTAYSVMPLTPLHDLAKAGGAGNKEYLTNRVSPVVTSINSNYSGQYIFSTSHLEL